MKKKYIVPNLVIVKVDTQAALAASTYDDPIEDDNGIDFANLGENPNWSMTGRAENDGEYDTSAKHHTAWDTWDE